MSRWKTLTTCWWTKNLFEIACATVVVALLVGGIAFAIVQAPSVQVVESQSTKTTEARSAAVPLSRPDLQSPEPSVPAAEDQFEIVCLPGDGLPDQFGCEVVSHSEGLQPNADPF
ncbi:MAG TPA: hypothetical protein VFV09_03315 [Actinomycetota bacterium]|jgi:hypothetical protein|nr:hypothetical protein [Actinomycetota bacterium]